MNGKGGLDARQCWKSDILLRLSLSDALRRGLIVETQQRSHTRPQSAVRSPQPRHGHGTPSNSALSWSR